MLVTHAIIIRDINTANHQNQSKHTKEELIQLGEDGKSVNLMNLRSSQLRLQVDSVNSISINVISSKNNVTVSVQNSVIYCDAEPHGGRGIHVLVLNQVTGSIMATRVFDTYSPYEDEAMTLFLSLVSDKRILVFAIKDEGSFQLRSSARDMLTRLGSAHARSIGWRDTWAMVTVKGEAGAVSEGYKQSNSFTDWASPVVISAEMTLSPGPGHCQHWPPGEETSRRARFCDKIEGYGSVCSCEDPSPIIFHPPPVLNNQIADVPVAIIASNRPHYLYRMLRTLLSANGANPEMITVFIDGFYDEPLAVAELFGLRGVQHAPIGVRNARISQHYKSSLSSTFQMFPTSKFAILLEEDLDVSPDFFSYFSQLVRVLDTDPSLYCVSAWNDQGYEHTSGDPTKVYRVETMPGLGWMLRRSLYTGELEPRWPTPDKTWDWDMWMRLPEIRRGRECLIPDVSRTYHFGSSGLNMNTYFHDIYFKKRSFNTVRDVELINVDSLYSAEYEKLLEYELSQATILTESDKSPCQEGFFPNSNSNIKANILFISMNNSKDFGTWLALAKCLHVWDLDARGFHKGLWRLNFNEIPLYVIGAPFSPYSKYKPDALVPLHMSVTKPEAIKSQAILSDKQKIKNNHSI